MSNLSVTLDFRRVYCSVLGAGTYPADRAPQVALTILTVS
jgi:hypothetical protein